MFLLCPECSNRIGHTGKNCPICGYAATPEMVAASIQAKMAEAKMAANSVGVGGLCIVTLFVLFVAGYSIVFMAGSHAGAITTSNPDVNTTSLNAAVSKTGHPSDVKKQEWNALVQRAKINLGYNDRDAEEVVKAAYKLDRALKARGKN